MIQGVGGGEMGPVVEGRGVRARGQARLNRSGTFAVKVVDQSNSLNKFS